MGSAAANEDVSGENNLTSDLSDFNLENGDDESKCVSLKISDDNSLLSAPQTWVVDEIEENHNEMSQSTIQAAIDKAGAGDTIIINGKSYVHCHFVVNKKLNIISNIGTSFEVCPSNTQGSGYKGIFYIAPTASGTVIDGFTIKNSVSGENDYGVLVRGASDVIIRNCSITHQGFGDAVRIENSKNVAVENVNASNAVNSIRIQNSQSVTVKKSEIKNSGYGIRIIDSNSTEISDNNINSNTIAGVAFSGIGKYLTVIYNNISDNGNGISLTSSDNVYILSNYISFNKNNGVYVDYNITKIEIKGNFFNQNYKWEVFNDFHVKNINDISVKNMEKLEIITNNYMINYGGYGSGDMDRPVWTQVYEYKPSIGDYTYDDVNDVYTYVGTGNGEYYGHQGIMFLGYVFEINEFVSCPNIYVSPQKIWSKSGNYELQLSQITQIKKGIYSVSITDADGNIASDLSSVPVTFYLNKADTSSSPKNGDVYKTVMMQNGTATVRFYMDEFAQSNNIITAVLPTPGTVIDSKVSKTFAVNDSDIPGIPLNTSIKVSDLNTYPNSNQEITVTLLDLDGNAIEGELVSYTFNSKTSILKTDSKGQIKIKISLSKEGTYTLKVNYAGDDVEYLGSSASANVVVKKANSKIVSSNLNMIPKMADYYSITLKDESGNALSNQKVTFKVNGKIYVKTTNSKGIAKIKLKFNKNKKTYKIKITYNGNNKYKSVSKTNKLTVRYSSKKAILTAPKVTVPPKTKTKYVVSLKDVNGKAIPKQKVIVKIANKKYSKKTNNKGQINFNVKFSVFKTYKVSAQYKGNNIYKKASAKGSIKVAKTSTIIAAPAVSALPNQPVKYTVTLKANNKALSKQKLTLNVNGKSYTKTTDSKGQVTLNLNFAFEKTYDVSVTYKGTGIYKASSGAGKINVFKIPVVLTAADKTYSRNLDKEFAVSLKDTSGNAIPNQSIILSFNGLNLTKTTDDNGVASFNLNLSTPGQYNIVSTYDGDNKYKQAMITNQITVSNKTDTVFVDKDLSNENIQNMLNQANEGSNIEFIGDSYWNLSLKVNNSLNIYSNNKSILNAKSNCALFTILSDNVNITGFSLHGSSGDAVIVKDANNICISDNVISNNLDESKSTSYAEGTLNLPGYGIAVLNSSNLNLKNNSIDSFESGIFAQCSSNLTIDNNTLRENNYGIKYGYGVFDSKITNNVIAKQIGLYIMTVPEGPTGYGVFLNNSACNVTIRENNISANHLGISIDANNSTGIIIIQNTISDSVLEGIRFNAGYDLAENAIEPVVTDNAIYRNARGPSMMILGEMSANPEGIYTIYNKLNIGPNWYGANSVATWDNDTGIVGYGTMCPRINTTEIKFNNLTCNSPGNYSVQFYKNNELASNLPKFNLYATLNRQSGNAYEVVFDVVNGVGTFTFDSSEYADNNNIIEISVGSLLYSTSRVFKVTYLYDVPQSEIPA